MMPDLPPLKVLPALVVKAEPPAPFPPAYNAAVDAVKSGKPVVLVVGKTDAADATHCCGSFPAVADGVYDCVLESNNPVMRRRFTPAAAPPVYQYSPLLPSLGVFRPVSGST